jgi:hypothetical protein
MKNSILKIRNEYDENSKEKPDKEQFLLKIKTSIFINSILISSENIYETYLDKSANDNKLIKLNFLKNIFDHKKSNYLGKEDFLKSASKDSKENTNNNNNIHYFKFKESISKSKKIFEKNHNLNKVLKENLDLEFQNQNPFLISQKQNNKLRKLSNKEKLNPCFFKGFYSNKTKIKGSGSYSECFKQFNESLGSKFAQMEDSSQNKTSVLLCSDFKDIADIIAAENTSIKNFNLFAEKICAKLYADIKQKYFFIANIDNICFKLCYASVVFSKLFKNNEKIILIFTTNIKNISPEAENEIIMSNYFSFQAESMPPTILILLVFFIFVFFCNYFFKDLIITMLKKELYKNELICICLKGIRKLISGNEENKQEEIGCRAFNMNNNNGNRTFNNMRNSRILEASQINKMNDNWLRKEEIEKESISSIIDLVREQDSDFRVYFDNKLFIKENYTLFNNNQFTLVNEYNVKIRENNRNNSMSNYNNNNNNKQSSPEEDIFYQKLSQEINLANSEEKKDILDTLINSLPVKNFLYTVLLKKIKDLCEREIFLSFSEFKLFFYTEVENEIQLKLVILETIEKRNKLKASKIFCLTQIFLAIILSILTNKIFSFVTFHNNYIGGIIIVLFSFLYMTLLIMECLILITLIDYEKYYYSNILTQSEKLFLEQEFSVEPNHNNELF